MPALAAILATMGAVACYAAETREAGDAAEPAPWSVSDYDGGSVYWVRDGRKLPYHDIREAWVFNRAMTWLDDRDGLDGAILCYSAQSPLLLTGRKQVSRWFTSKANSLEDADEEHTRFVKKGPDLDWDHAGLPPLQFHVEQHPTAEIEVTRATHPWQLLVVVKGRTGPPLYASPWQEGPGKLAVNVRDLYRAKGYRKQFAEMHFFVAVKTERPADEAATVFRLRLIGQPAVIVSLPVIRTHERARREGVPVYAVVLDAAGHRLGRDAVAVAASCAGQTIDLSPVGSAVWGGRLRDLPPGEHRASVRAVFRDNSRPPATSTLYLCVTDGMFFDYDAGLKLLTREGKPFGPLTGSYRGCPMFRGIGTPGESLVHGQQQWEAVRGDRHEGQYFNHGGPKYGFHAWESLAPAELDADYAYLHRCGWSLVHLCQGWWAWERLDAGGRIAPHGAEQLAEVLGAAGRNKLWIHLALSHYPLGKAGQPYAQYLEAGYRPSDYRDPNSTFYRLFEAYLRDFGCLFRDHSALSSFTAAGEGDVDCGKTFVNRACEVMRQHAPRQLFLCEPHPNPKPYPSDPNYYRREGWTPLLGGMRTYAIDRLPPEHVGVQFKLGAMGHVFLGEGVFWGFMNAPRELERYRRRVRQEFYTGLAYRSPIQLSWEERVVEDERVVFEQVRQAVDWSTKFARPRLALRIGSDLGVLHRYERALARLPLEYCFVLKDEPAPEGTLFVLDTRQAFAEPAFVAQGGNLPEALRADVPLRLPSGHAANYAWSDDRTVLLAYIRRDDDSGSAAKDAEPARIVLQNFPARRLRLKLFDLAEKKAIDERQFQQEHRTALVGSPSDLFLLIGP